MSRVFLPAHKALQDGALPGALLAHHSDLRQLEAAALPGAAQGVLQAIDQRDQLLHPPVAHRSKSSPNLCRESTRPSRLHHRVKASVSRNSFPPYEVC